MNTRYVFPGCLPHFCIVLHIVVIEFHIVPIFLIVTMIFVYTHVLFFLSLLYYMILFLLFLTYNSILYSALSSLLALFSIWFDCFVRAHFATGNCFVRCNNVPIAFIVLY